MVKSKKMLAEPGKKLKSVKVGYADFKIKEFPYEQATDEDEDDENVELVSDQGETHFDDHTIYYNPAQCPVEHTNTILHELLHSITYVFGLKFSSPKKEEEAVNTFANGLTTVFRDNPELLEWISKQLKK